MDSPLEVLNDSTIHIYKILGSKKYWVKKNDGFRKMLGPNDFVSRKIPVQKNAGPKNVWSKKMLGPNNFWTKMIWGSKKSMGPKMFLFKN